MHVSVVTMHESIFPIYYFIFQMVLEYLVDSKQLLNGAHSSVILYFKESLKFYCSCLFLTHL